MTSLTIPDFPGEWPPWEKGSGEGKGRGEESWEEKGEKVSGGICGERGLASKIDFIPIFEVL